ncbi:hypothetical protein GCM10009611_05590 [Arthrobacter roseus]
MDGFELDHKGSTRPQGDDPQQEQRTLIPSFNEDWAVCQVVHLSAVVSKRLATTPALPKRTILGVKRW